MADKYANLSDEELIRIIRADTEHTGEGGAATEFLMEKYKGLVRSKAQSMYILGGSTDDLIQEGMIGLFKAVRDYDAGRDTSFSTFADLCISRQMFSAIQASGRKKNMPLNTAISLYSEISREEDGSASVLADVLSADCHGSSPYGGQTGANPEEQMIEEENIRQLLAQIEKALSPLEEEVMSLTLTGMGYAEIARVLGRDEKSTDNALQRGRSKIRRILRERDIYGP